MKSEIMVHQYINNLRINAPYFFYGKSSISGNKTETNFIIMEFLENYLHLYNILEDELYYEAVRSLGEMHLISMKKIDYLKNKLKIPVYDITWYLKNVDRIIFDISRLSINFAHSDFLPKDLISKLQRSAPKIKFYLNEIKEIPNSLVHGDFDSGNIIFFQKGKHIGTVKVLDWGHGHIGPPVIDIAHLFNSLGYFDYERKIMLIAEYLKTCRPLYSQNVEFSLLIIAGTIVHYLYHLNFKLKAISENYVYPEFFIEQIHKRVEMLTKIVK
jgi:aminoglycoside/choline kinase family phosphotransferase